MKKTFIATALILLYVTSFGQPIVNRSGQANTVVDARWGALYNMLAPRYADTTAANLQIGIDSSAAIIFTYDVNGFWYRQSNPKKWVRLGSGDGTTYTFSEGLTAVGTSVTLGGAFTSARTLATSGNAFNITGLTNSTSQNRLLGQIGASGQMGYITIGSGLSLASGTLSSSGGGGGSIDVDTITYQTKNTSTIRRLLRDRLNEINYSIIDFGASSGGSASSNRVAIQRAVDAAEITGGVVFIPIGTYSIDSTIRVKAKNVWVIGQGEGSKISATGDFGDIFHAEPTSSGSIGTFTGIRFSNFYIETVTNRTSGAAIHTKYTSGVTFDGIRIGTIAYNGASPAVMMYDGIRCEIQSYGVMLNTSIGARHYGVYVDGDGSGAINSLDWDFLVTSNCNIFGDRNSGSWVTGSVGIVLGGGTGGVQVEQCAVTWFENGVRVKSGGAGINRELFIGHAFAADDMGGAGFYVEDSALNILQMTGAWAAGCGRGAQTPDAAVYVTTNNEQLSITVTGGTYYLNEGAMAAFYIGSGAFAIAGASVFNNVVAGKDFEFGTGVIGATITGCRLGSVTPVTNNSSITPILRSNIGPPDQGGSLGFTSGAIPYINSSGYFSQDAANLWYDGTNHVMGLGTVSPVAVLDVRGTDPNGLSTAFPNFRSGKLELQTYDADQSWMGHNVYFNGSTFKYRANGATNQIYFAGNEMQNRSSASGTGGTDVTQLIPFKANSIGVVAMGGNISNISGTYTGATALVRSDSLQFNKRASYNSNLHSTFTDYTLIDKAYLDSIMAAVGAGTVTNVSATDANGFDFTITNPSSTPNITLTTTVADGRIMYSNSGAITGSANFTTDGSAISINTTAITNSTLRVGTLEFQPYAVNNAWFGDNFYYNNVNFLRRSNGYAGAFYFQSPDAQFRLATTSTAGSTITWVVPGKFNLDGTAAIGGDISTTSSTYTGATLLANTTKVGIGQNIYVGNITTTPTAYLHIKAGTSSASTAPIKFTSGTNMSSAEAGAMEWDGSRLYITQSSGPTRRTIAYLNELNSAVVTGTYTPTLTNTANLDASTAHVCQYTAITDPQTGLTVVTVSGYVEVDPTTTLTDTQLTISVPVNSGFTNIQECGGVANSTTIAGQSAGIRAVASSGNVMMQWKTADVTNQPMYFTFTYKVTTP